MAWLPISGLVPQATENGNQANGMVLKFYEPGTVTPLAMATDNTGGTTTTEFVLDTAGYTTLSSAKVIPHANRIYKVALYLNQVDANANDVGSAVFVIDDINIGGFSQSLNYDDVAEALASVDGAVGDYVKTIQRVALSGVGGATYLIVAPGSGTDDGGSFITKTDGSLNQLQLIPKEGIVYATQWGTVADGTTSGGTDNAPMINAAITYVNANRPDAITVILPQGSHSIESPIDYKQSVNLIGHGTQGGSAGGTELICNFSAGTIATPPTDNITGRYSPVLDWSPMIYNTDLLTQQRFGNLRLNCNNKDVYGVYLNEWYYMKNLPIFVINCNKAPITLVVGQFNEWDLMTYNGCNAGARFIGCDTFSVRSLDTESNTITGAALEVIHDQAFSTKAGVTINQWHYEETASEFPTIFARISGRNTIVLNSSFGTNGTPGLREIDLLGSVAYSFDGVNITTEQSVNTRFLAHSFSSAGSGTFNLNSGSVGAVIRCDSSALTNVVDNSGNSTNQVDSLTGGQRLPRDATIRNSTGGRMMFYSSDNLINLFDNNNRYIEQSGANMNINNDAGQMYLNASSNLNLQGALVDFDASGGVNAGRFDADATAGNTRLLVFDVDNNTLERVSVGAADSGGAGFKVLRIPN